MIEYRAFRNDDPPRVAEVWSASFAGPRTVPVSPRATTILEYFLLAKPYFDRGGLVLAFDDARPVGLALAGLLGAPDAPRLDPSRGGVVCALGVVPDYRRRGIGAELLRRAEDFLRARGATRAVAGSMAPHNPYLFGLYGGCDSPGFLATHPLAQPFFEKRGYAPARRCLVLQRSLQAVSIPPDPRFADHRQRYDIVGAPLPAAGWWVESVLGPVEVFEYALRDKVTDAVVARLLLWDMELYSQVWGQSAVGLLDFAVEPAFRRRGLGKYLLFQVLRHLSEQTFNLFEAQVNAANDAAVAFFTAAGFARADAGLTLERDLS